MNQVMIWKIGALTILSAIAMTWENHAPVTHKGVINDIGFIYTTPLYEFLKAYPVYNDTFAFLNTMVCAYAFFYLLYQAHKTGNLQIGYYICICQFARLLCHTMTTLPVPNEYLDSDYDWPNILWVMTGTTTSQSPGFAIFFSGHVCNLKLFTSYLKKSGSIKTSYLFEVLNGLQMIRILATRGHYSIDVLVGYFVAVFCSGYM